MKRLLILLPALLLLWSSCKQTYFVSEDDVYSYTDHMALRPKSGDVKPEASYDGFVYNEENGQRSTFYDPQNDLKQNHATHDSRIVNNYYFNDYYDPWGSFYHPRRNWRFRTNVYLSYGWNSWGSSWGYNPWGPSWGYNPWAPHWNYNAFCYSPYGWNSWGMSPWGYNPYGYYHQPWGGMYGHWGHHGGMGWNSWSNNGMGQGVWNNWGSNNSGFGGNNNSTHFGPRPNISSSHNPNNLNVGKGNVSPVGSNGQPVTETLITNSGRKDNTQQISPIEVGAKTQREDRQTLAGNSSPWSPRVEGRSDLGTSNRSVSPNPNLPNSSRGDASNSNWGNSRDNSARPSSSNPRPSAAPGSTNSRPSSVPSASPSPRPSSVPSSPNSRPSSYPSSPSPRPSSAPSSPSPRPSSVPNSPSPRPSSAPSSPSPRPSSAPSFPSSRPSSAPSSPRPSSFPSSGGGSRGGSPGGSSGGSRGGRP